MDKPKKYKRLNLKKKYEGSFIFNCTDTSKNASKLMQVILYPQEKQKINQKIQTIKAKISHPNIMPIQDYYYSNFKYEFTSVEEALFIISDCKQDVKDIKSKITAGQNNTPTQIHQFYQKMKTALQHLHKNGIIHKNISSQNVYFNKKKDFLLHLFLNFKYHKNSLEASKIFLQSDSKYYKSPKIIQQNTYIQTTDLWALGIILIELYLAKSIVKIRQNQIPKVPALDPQFPTKQLSKIDNKQIRQIIGNITKSDIQSYNGILTPYKYIEQEQNILKEFKKNIQINQFLQIRPNCTNIQLSLQLIQDIPFEFLAKVTSIVLYDIKIKDIYFLYASTYPNLKKLYLNQNQISDISVLKYVEFENLILLNLRGNKISNIDCIKDFRFPNLLQLNLSKNEIEDISSLLQAQFYQLISLDLSSNKITNRDNLLKLRNHFPKLKSQKKQTVQTLPTSIIINDMNDDQYHKRFLQSL